MSTLALVTAVAALGPGSLFGHIQRIEGLVKLTRGKTKVVLSAKDVGKPVHYGDFLWVGEKSVLVTQLARRTPRVWKPARAWQPVVSGDRPIETELGQRRMATFATMASKGQSSAIACDFAYGFTVSFPGAKGTLSAKLEQYNETVWEGQLVGDGHGLFTNPGLYSILAARRGSQMTLRANGKVLTFHLRTASQEAEFLDALARVELIPDADERAFARLELYESKGLVMLAARELRRLTGG